MPTENVESESCSPRCGVLSVRNRASHGLGPGSTWECPRCGATWRLTKIGSMSPTFREHRWEQIGSGSLPEQLTFDVVERQRVGLGCLVVFLVVALLAVVLVTLTMAAA